MGYDLPAAMTKAGLRLESVRAEAIVQTPEISYSIHEIVRAVTPRIVQEGIATQEQIDVSTLEARLLEERTPLEPLILASWFSVPGHVRDDLLTSCESSSLTCWTPGWDRAGFKDARLT